MPTCQGQHPDESQCRNRTPEEKDRCYIHRRPDLNARLTREDVLAAIEEHEKPLGLDLTHEDLCRIDMGQQAIGRELGSRGLRDPPWYWSAMRAAFLAGANLQGADLGGANLQGANLAGANLQGAVLWSADLQGACLWSANLRGAGLGHAEFQGADLVGANLQGAHLREANLQGAHLREANLQGAHLGDAKLERVDLTGAKDLTKIRWYGAVLDKTRLRREQLGEKIGDELAAEKGEGTFDQAREAYLALKTNFNELGRYDDASWAYRKERRMERAMRSWRRAAREYKEEMDRLQKDHPRSWKPRFYGGHAWKWWWDLVAEKLTDYGENPWLAIRAVLILWALFGLLYSSVGTIGPAELAKVQTVKVLDFWAILAGLIYSLAALGTVGLESLLPLDRLTEFLTAFEGVLGISLLALLMFTLGKRISRS